ncbi:MAG: SIS domain-containing protein [Elusimicrobia bacterium]|nr:SIS domain-containing protein [Elusimicrobiota bacterium]
MRSEILEQPDVLARVLSKEAVRARRIGAQLRRLKAPVAVLAARGSSDHAAVVAKYLIEWAAGVPVALAAPSLATLYKTKLALERSLVVGVSQSGKSPDVVEYVRLARAQGAFTVGVTNDPKSPLAKASAETLLCHAGPEKSVAATKTFTAQVACLALLAAEWAEGARASALERGLKEAPAKLRRLLTGSELPDEWAHRLAAAERCVVLARGFAYPAALEAALKLKESAGLPCEGASAADYLHGPIAAAGPGLAALLFAPKGPGRSTVTRVAAQLKAAGADLLWADAAGWPEPLCGLPLVAQAQQAAYRLALLKGRDPDEPPRLRKVTTTW